MKLVSCLLACAAICCASVGCAPQKIQPQKTQLQIREIQTRTYTSKDLKLVMKAVLNALQDEGYLVKSADKELGFISATKEVDVEDATNAFLMQLFGGAQARYNKSAIMDASANISEFGKETKVRIIFQVKIIDNFGGPVETKQVDDLKTYQDFFAKVDKSVFIEKAKI